MLHSGASDAPLVSRYMLGERSDAGVGHVRMIAGICGHASLVSRSFRACKKHRLSAVNRNLLDLYQGVRLSEKTIGRTGLWWLSIQSNGAASLVSVLRWVEAKLLWAQLFQILKHGAPNPHPRPVSFQFTNGTLDSGVLKSMAQALGIAGFASKLQQQSGSGEQVGTGAPCARCLVLSC